MGAPGIPLKAVKWMFEKHAPLAIRPDGTLFQLRWMWQMLKNCDIQHYAMNKSRMVRIAEYSRDCIRQLRVDTGIEYEARQGGTLQLFRTAEQFDNAANDIAVLQQEGVPYELLTSNELVKAEPALEFVKHKLTGGCDYLMMKQGIASNSPKNWLKWRKMRESNSNLVAGLNRF